MFLIDDGVFERIRSSVFVISYVVCCLLRAICLGLIGKTQLPLFSEYLPDIDMVALPIDANVTNK